MVVVGLEGETAGSSSFGERSDTAMVAGGTAIKNHCGYAFRRGLFGEQTPEGLGAFGFGSLALGIREFTLMHGKERFARDIVDELGRNVLYRTEYGQTRARSGSGNAGPHTAVTSVSAEAASGCRVHYFAPAAFTTLPAFRRTSSPE
jgi:hypothetical protein